MEEKLKILHVRSGELNKVPSANTLDYGEIAVNYNASSPNLYIKDSDGKVVGFISESYFNKIVGTGITENDGTTFVPLSEIIQQDEKTISAALNDINDRKADKSYVDSAVSSITIDVDSELDSASTNPVENRAIYKAIVDDEKSIAAAINDLNDRKADIDYVDAAVSSITIDVDNELDSGSTNPLQNRAIYQILEEDEIAISAALNDLNDRKADIDYVDDAISGVTIDVLDYIDSASTLPVESQAIWGRFDEDERVIAGALNDLNDKIAVTAVTETGSGSSVTSATLNGKTLQIGYGDVEGLPAVTSADNGKILRVVNGEWAIVNPSTIYSGGATPAQNLGSNGDIYLQTS